MTEAHRLTVSQASELIRTTLESRIASPLRIIGEVSNLSVRQHWYFSLKDEHAVLSCVAWASSAKKFDFTPRDGDEIVATGHISHFSPQGRTQFYVSRIEAIGAGVLELRFRVLCRELRELGYFDESRKQSLPLFPRRLAVITSATGAAWQDVMATAKARCPAVGLLLIDVRVQGESAAAEIANAIRFVDREHHRLGVDALLVTRGGGSLEDLWAFNERLVADAVFQCTLPVVAAIGHESDVTVIELVADRRAATPTQAVMLLVPDQDDLRRQARYLDDRLALLLRRRVERARELIRTIARHSMFRYPHQRVRDEERRLERLHADAARAVQARLAAARLRFEQVARRLGEHRPVVLASLRRARIAVLEDRLHRSLRLRIRQHGRLQKLAARLHAVLTERMRRERERSNWLEDRLAGVGVHSVLRRGFTYTQREDGRLVRARADVMAGDLLTTHVADGAIRSVVGGSAPRPKRRPRTPGDASSPPNQLDLFPASE